MEQSRIFGTGDPPQAGGVNPLDTMARRAYFKARLTYLGVWNEIKWEEIAEMAENVISIELCQDGYRSVPRAFFDYTVDDMVWEKYVSDSKLDQYEDCWPWCVYPSIRDSRGGVSPFYKQWRILNGLYIDEPNLETPTREVDPATPAEYKRLQSSSAAGNKALREGPTGKQATSSLDPNTKVLSKGAAEKQPAFWSASNTLDPSEGTFVNPPASKLDSGSANSSSRQTAQKPGYVHRTQEEVPLTRRWAHKATTSQTGPDYAQGRGSNARSESQRHLPTTPGSGKASHPWILSLHRR